MFVLLFAVNAAVVVVTATVRGLFVVETVAEASGDGGPALFILLLLTEEGNGGGGGMEGQAAPMLFPPNFAFDPGVP